MSIVAVDVGGTFTDFIYVKSDGSLGYFKVLSTPRSPEVAVIEGLKFIGDVREVIHASTIATNALRGQVGLELPRVALITTKGFRDVLEIGRQNRPRLYDPFFEKPKPLVPRSLRFEVDVRIDYRGGIVKPLSVDELEALGLKLQELGVESVAVTFLHSYINPIYEVIAGSVLSKMISFISLSHRVVPEPREYERVSTTVVNAALTPLVSRYISRLSDGLKSLGVERVHLMSSSGGLIDVNEVIDRPVQFIESGPAAGVVASAELAKMLREPNVISFDMGGTTAKAGTVVNFEFEITSEYEVGGESHHGRIVKGSGYPVRFPFIDLAEVSAGGGTIIWRDEVGALKVGPISAGADPGPVCYGRGGVEPTLTDANLVLGRLGEYLLGGSMRLEREASIKALSKLGDPYDVSREAISLANLEMARAIRLVTVERGLDLEGFILIAFGGAGPQHALDIAEELGIRRVIISPHPGVFSALGLLMADWRFEARTAFPANLEDAYSALEDKLAKKIRKVDYYVRYADVRYEGQGWELTVPVGRPAVIDDVRRAFEEKHLATFGFNLDRDIEVVVARVFAVITRVKPKIEPPKHLGEFKARGSRLMHLRDEMIEVPVYWRDDIPVGAVIEGPALIEEYDSTTVLLDGWRLTVGEFGELRIER
ncbi:MAG: hydantoinase/oxoprolinase family protein [Thermoprotei archaeon]